MKLGGWNGRINARPRGRWRTIRKGSYRKRLLHGELDSSGDVSVQEGGASVSITKELVNCGEISWKTFAWRTKKRRKDGSLKRRVQIIRTASSFVISINPLAPNDVYIRRTAQLTSRRCILNIYSTNILTEYFKHAAHSQFFLSLFKMPFIS